MLICPICKKDLKQVNNSYICSNKHTFDIAKEGYVNLLLNKPKAGDNKLMISSRKSFLNKGHFLPLALRLVEIIKKFNILNPTILDVGCAEGYYTKIFYKHFSNILGLDISKDAIKMAAKNAKDIKFIVASGKDIPIKNNTIDIIVNIFSPHFVTEFLRILKDTRYLVKVTPNKNHLLELKQILYEDVYLTKEKFIENKNFKIYLKDDLKYTINLENIDIINLMQMTPYFYKTKEENLKKIETINNISITLDFNITVYQKIK